MLKSLEAPMLPPPLFGLLPHAAEAKGATRELLFDGLLSDDAMLMSAQLLLAVDIAVVVAVTVAAVAVVAGKHAWLLADRSTILEESPYDRCPDAGCGGPGRCSCDICGVRGGGSTLLLLLSCLTRLLVFDLSQRQRRE